MDIKELFRKYLNDEASDLEKSTVENWVAALFEKVQSGKATAGEMAIVREWLEQFNLNDSDSKGFTEKMKRDKSEVWNNIHERREQPTGEKDHFKKKKIAFLKYAAILIVILVISVLIYNTGRNKETAFLNKTISPSDSAIRLTCNKGESAKRFILPDSTHIYLNSNSTIIYLPCSYNIAGRVITLEKGSAFFEVTKNAAQPFIVQTKSLTVTVTGTSFEVFTDTVISKSSVSVKSGSVAVSQNTKTLATLHAGQALTLNMDNDQFKVGHVSKTAAQWVSGDIIFSDAGIDEIKHVLQNRFNINVASKSNQLNKSIKFNATFGKEATIAEVAATVSSLYNVRYSITKDSLVFY